MIHFDESSKLQFLSAHYVGNRVNNETLLLTTEPISMDENLSILLANFFQQPFKTEEYFHFTHPSDVQLNEVYSYVSAIFKDFLDLHENSEKLAKHLFRVANHQNIKGGEFFVAYFKNVILDGETMNCIGLFKTEDKDVFIKVQPDKEQFEIQSHEGINIKKLDKGCLIFNTEKEEGYVVAVVDKTNRNSEMAQYWIDDFLQVEQREDAYYNTQSTLDLYRNFVVQQLPEEYEMNKVDQADMLNRTMSYFKENEEFKQNHFAHEVLGEEELIDSFKQYSDYYQKDRKINIADSFAINDAAVKKQSRVYKSVIKLDKNFHIYVHGDRSKIERGEDTGGKYYKVYFTEEH